eukprot:4715554-Prymnesium_polylepis.2
MECAIALLATRATRWYLACVSLGGDPNFVKSPLPERIGETLRMVWRRHTVIPSGVLTWRWRERQLGARSARSNIVALAPGRLHTCTTTRVNTSRVLRRPGEDTSQDVGFVLRCARVSRNGVGSDDVPIS